MVGHNLWFWEFKSKDLFIWGNNTYKSQLDIINANLVIKNKLQVGNLGCLWVNLQVR